MAGWLNGAVDAFVGVTGSGKTTLAQKRVLEFVTREKCPRVIIDLESAADWARIPHAVSADEVLDTVYVKRQHARVWTPRDERERAKFFMAVSHWGGVATLVDGVPMICNDHYFEEEFRKMLFRHRHGKLGACYHALVAQRASLLHRHVYAATRYVEVFRQAPGVDADRMWREFKVSPDVSTQFKRGEHVTVTLGFPEGS